VFVFVGVHDFSVPAIDGREQCAPSSLDMTNVRRGWPVDADRAQQKPRSTGPGFLLGADDQVRTGDLNLGKVALYQLSYVRIASDQLSLIGASTSLPDPPEWSER
jgi:hypothetical protein